MERIGWAATGGSEEGDEEEVGAPGAGRSEYRGYNN